MMYRRMGGPGVNHVLGSLNQIRRYSGAPSIVAYPKILDALSVVAPTGMAAPPRNSHPIGNAMVSPHHMKPPTTCGRSVTGPIGVGKTACVIAGGVTWGVKSI